MCASEATAQQEMVLNLLRFRSIHERFEGVTVAQATTFKWLLYKNTNEDTIGPAKGAAIPLDKDLTQARERFLQWLEAGEGFFYISGKPGAGKSTLMKFICSHANFRRHLEVWAAESTLLVGRFFFWKPGQPEQKSISGLLRGLLYSILKSSPAITAVAFPELCEKTSNPRLIPNEINDHDIKRAFENILANSATHKTHRIVLVVDGLDEFEGNHADLLVLLQAWVANYPSTIKICVSSREFSIFEEFFCDYPKMRLHELTRNDMAQLITYRLKSNKILSSPAFKDASGITDIIVERAQGVFLWVVMVVATIEDGLLSRDIANASEVERKVRLCPPELDDLFPHLLLSVTAHHRSWAYRAMSLVQFAQFQVPKLLSFNQAYPGVGLLDLMLLDEASPTWNLSTFQPRSDSKALDLATRLETARKKVLGRCKGFLSIVTTAGNTSWPANGDERMYAALTHRSIVEYLESDAAISQMGIYLTDFDPLLAHLSTVLACLRYLPPSHYPLLKSGERVPQRDSLELTDVLDDSLQIRLKEFVRCGFLLGRSGSSRFLSLLDAIGDAIKRHLTIQLIVQKVRIPVTSASPHAMLVTLTLGERVYEYSEWRRRQAIPSTKTLPMTLSMYKAFSDIIHYFRLDDYKFPILSQTGSTSLAKKPHDWIRWNWVNIKSSLTLARFSKLLTEFFANGIDLNWFPIEDYASISWMGSTTIDNVPWTCWQMFLWSMLVCEVPYTHKYAEYVKLFLIQGADPDIEIFSVAPIEPLYFDRLNPQDGWILLVPYTGNRESARSIVNLGLTSHDNSKILQELDRVPIALIRDSASIYQRAMEKSWLLNLRELVTLWFPQEINHFSALLDDLSKSKDTSGPEKGSLICSNYAVECNTEILGTPRGASDFGVLVEEMKVQSGISGTSTTIFREVRVT